MTISIASLSPQSPAAPLRQNRAGHASGLSPASAQRFSGKVDWAQRIHQLLPPAKFEKLGGFSLEDLSFRGGLIFAVYAPQQYLAMKYKQQPWETFLRNTLVLIGSLTIIHYSRGPFNTFVNQFMTRKKDTKDLPRLHELKGWDKAKAWFEHKLFNPKRPTFNYLESLFNAGIKLESLGIKIDKPKLGRGKKDINPLDELLYKLFKSNPKPIEELKLPENQDLKAHLMKKLDKEIEKKVHWSSMDYGRKKVILDYRAKLLEQIKTMGSSSPERRALQDAAHVIETTMKRMFWGRFAGAMISAVFTALVVGIWIQKLVFKLAAPLDKKYQPKVPGREAYTAPTRPALPLMAQQVLPAQGYRPQSAAMGPGGRPWA